VFATHDDPGYCQAFPCVNRVSLAALVNSVPGVGSKVMNIAVLGAGLGEPRILLLSAIYFGRIAGNHPLTFWLPSWRSCRSLP